MIGRRARTLVVLAVLLAVLAASLYWVSRPDHAASLLLDRIGKGMGLEISASGVTEYRLRGTPMLLLRNVVVRQPGAVEPLLRAERIYLSLPWSTIRARGSDLTVKRIELDQPQLDLQALQRWLATRPPSRKRLPTLTAGMLITDGSIVNDDLDGNGNWRIDRIYAALPSLYPDRPLQARMRGRYLDLPVTIPFDLAVALLRPQALITATATGCAAHGRVTVQRGDWRMPATVTLSGPLKVSDDNLRVRPARIGIAASYESRDMRVPFALGLYGPLAYQGTWALAPAGFALRERGMTPDDPVPTLDAHGTLAFGRHLALHLDGAIAHWPDAWPALPPPLAQSRSPLPFTLGYDGKLDFTDTTALRIRRDATRFDGRFHLHEVLAWTRAAASGSPLPPIDGTLSTPALEISGARLESVEVEFKDDPAPPSLR